jgi:hypothetical protein
MPGGSRPAGTASDPDRILKIARQRFVNHLCLGSGALAQARLIEGKMEHPVSLTFAPTKPSVERYFDTPRYWRERAKQAREWAEKLPPVRRNGMLQIAEEYDQLAETIFSEGLLSLARYSAV